MRWSISLNVSSSSFLCHGGHQHLSQSPSTAIRLRIIVRLYGRAWPTKARNMGPKSLKFWISCFTFSQRVGCPSGAGQ